jgi:hypothetical protein
MVFSNIGPDKLQPLHPDLLYASASVSQPRPFYPVTLVGLNIHV